MSQIYLIRHGQASLGKANYDQLSAIGQQQASKLGEHLSRINKAPSLIISGSMKRHQQTADAVLDSFDANHTAQQIIDPRWNEFDFEILIRRYLEEIAHDQPKPTKTSEFFSALKKALYAWSDGQLTGEMPETWEQFNERIRSALTDLLSHDRERIFVFSSGGAISMAIKHVMRLDPGAMIDLNLQTRNTGVSELISSKDRCYVSSLNHVAHLLTPDTIDLITYA